MIKLMLKNAQCPGDIVMMTAAIRDLHATYPGEYKTDVRCPCPEIFEGNPHITSMDTTEVDMTIRMEYPLINECNEGAYHFIHAYRKHLEEKVGRPIKQGVLRGDMYIRDEERGWASVVKEITNDNRSFWIIDAGYKKDYTAKMWWFNRYQEVVDHYKDKIQFVQMGHQHHIHVPLKGVINLIGQTDLRQLIRLVYHSDGVLTPVSLPMVLAAAVPTRWGGPVRRAGVVISGGREPTQWQMYPEHQFLHTIGALSCCDNGGCWKSRVIPMGDGENHHDSSVCLQPIYNKDGEHTQKAVPRCLDMITTDDVIRSIDTYYKGGTLKYLSNEMKTTHVDYKGR